MSQVRQYPDAAAKQRAYRARQAEAHRAELAAKGLPSAPAIPTLPSTARWAALIEHASLALETVLEEMQSYRDERSNAWQESDRAAVLGEQITALEQALDELGTI
jgi:hypothetical protein